VIRALAICLLSSPLLAAAAVESEPSLPTATLAPKGVALSGPGYRVATPTAVRGYLGDFVVRLSDGREVRAQGAELLAIRIAEVPAIARLDEVSRREVFADAIAESARKTGRAVVRVVTQPVETAKGLPSGVARFVRSTARSVRNVAVAVGDAARRESSDEAGEGSASGDGAEKATDFARELAGVNKARRAIARSMGIDPYTGNPLLQARLEELAWASVAGGLSIDLALGAVAGLAGEVISVTGKLDGLVWDLPPDEIRGRLEKELVERGAEPMAAREFLRNGSFTPTLQLAFVGALRGIGRPTGEADVLALATGVRGEVHARFLVHQLRMLAQHAAPSDPVAELLAFDASLGARTRGGALLVALPVDYLSWTSEIEAAVREHGGARPRVVVSGAVSSLARKELGRAGWQFTADAGIPR
jgi:hypothetical protein